MKEGAKESGAIKEADIIDVEEENK